MTPNLAGSPGRPPQGRRWSSACTQRPQTHLPFRARPCFSVPWFWSENVSSGPAACIIPRLSDDVEEFLANQALCTHRPLFSSSCSFAPFLWLGNLPPLLRQGWAVWIVFICWHSGVKAHPVNCILILSAVCIYFPRPCSPGLIYGFPFHGFLLSLWQGALCSGCSGLRQEQDLSL